MCLFLIGQIIDTELKVVEAVVMVTGVAVVISVCIVVDDCRLTLVILAWHSLIYYLEKTNQYVHPVSIGDGPGTGDKPATDDEPAVGDEPAVDDGPATDDDEWLTGRLNDAEAEGASEKWSTATDGPAVSSKYGGVIEWLLPNISPISSKHAGYAIFPRPVSYAYPRTFSTMQPTAR